MSAFEIAGFSEFAFAAGFFTFVFWMLAHFLILLVVSISLGSLIAGIFLRAVLSLSPKYFCIRSVAHV